MCRTLSCKRDTYTTPTLFLKLNSGIVAEKGREDCNLRVLSDHKPCSPAVTGSSTRELTVTVIANARPGDAQAKNHPSVEEENGHKVLALAQELLAAKS